MKAAVVFTGSGPILILTTSDSLTTEKFVEKLEQKGIEKFLMYEVPIERCQGNVWESLQRDPC